MSARFVAAFVRRLDTSDKAAVKRACLAGFLALAAACLFGSAGALAASPTPDGPTAALTWYSSQLHLHGWTNHNALREPASMQYYSTWARDIGLDVMWWTDHNRAFDQYDDLQVDFTGATVHSNLDVQVPFVSPAPWFTDWFVGWLAASQSGNGQAAAAAQDGWLRMEVEAGSNQPMSRFQYRALSVNRTAVFGHFLNRPLLSDPVLSFDARLCGDRTPDAYAEVKVGLSWHNNGRRAPQELVYRLAPADVPPAVVHSAERITMTVPLTSSHVALPLLSHAAALPDGADNAVQELYLAVGAANGARACLQVRNLTLHSRQPEPAANFAALRQMAQQYTARYGVTQLASWEQNAGRQHFNPFLPADADLIPGRNDIFGPKFVPLIHAAGGLVVLNHPFGASYPPLLPDAQQEEVLRSVLQELLAARAWRVDGIEIYRARAGMDLTRHLKLWDLLAANGIPLCGLMTSDQHGGPLDGYQAAEVSWIEAAAPEQDLLLQGLRRCRVFFGNLRLFDGVLDLRLGDVAMGQTARLAQSPAPLQIIADPLPPGAVVKLIQVANQPGAELAYLIDHQPVDVQQPIWIDVTRPGFVRVEVWSARGERLAFSNRILIAPPGQHSESLYLPLFLVGATTSAPASGLAPD